MQIKKYPLGELQANCYLLIQDKKCLMIDPGDNADFLLEEIARQNWQLEAILATHGHFDHIMGAGNIQTSVDKPLAIHDKDLFLVKRLKETVKQYVGYDTAIIMPETKSISEGRLKVSSFTFQVISTPGHTPGSVCFLFEEESIIFTGDTLFKNAVGRHNFSYGSKSDLKKSIEKLIGISEYLVVHPGHGEDTTVQEEKERAFTFF